MTLPEIVLDLRVQIERLLPGWEIFARLDNLNFEFFGWKGSVLDCIHSESYKAIYPIPDAQSIAQYMQVTLDGMKKYGHNL